MWFKALPVLAILASSNAFAHSGVCHGTTDPAPTFELRCDPWIPQEGLGAVGGDNSAQIEISNVHCDGQGSASGASLIYAQVEERSMIPDGDAQVAISTDDPVAPPYGDQHTHLVKSISYAENAAKGSLQVTTLGQFNHEDESTLSLDVQIDESKALPYPSSGKMNGVSHPAVITITKTSPTGIVQTVRSPHFFCGEVNHGLTGLQYTPATGFQSTFAR